MPNIGKTSFSKILIFIQNLSPSRGELEIMKIYRTTEALREPSLIGQKPFVFIAPVNP